MSDAPELVTSPIWGGAPRRGWCVDNMHTLLDVHGLVSTLVLKRDPSI